MSDPYERARQLIPGGVSSPARAFGAVGGDPVFARRGTGPYIVDDQNNKYIDYIQGFGAVILGHASVAVTNALMNAIERGGATGLSSDQEVALASLVVERVASVERVRFVTSGTEASMTAARIARAATGRDVIVKFEGCYHGHADPFLAKAGSGVATFGVPNAVGVPYGSVGDTLVLPYNDREALEIAFQESGERIACVFVEPIAANMGVIRPDPGFLASIGELTKRYGALSIFDEVVTGFRVAEGGAQELFGLGADLTMFGKVLGGGLPIGAVGGRADLMDLLAPVGSVYQAGTYAAHPHAMVAGAATLSELTPDRYASLRLAAMRLGDGLEAVASSARAEVSVVRAETFLCVFFAPVPPRNFSEVQATDRDAFARFHRAMRARGVLLPPSPFEAWFPSLAHSADVIDHTIEIARDAFSSIT
ncbi:MAG: glutamate-1-semialdehyde 2,1-aminomutase [Actinomycetota bacterium]